MPTATAETVRNDLRTFIAQTFFIGDGGGEFSDSDSFMQNGIIDSTGVLELTSFIEERYQITVDDKDMTPANLDSVNNLVGYITARLK
jgi:acyl carrier protein